MLKGRLKKCYRTVIQFTTSMKSVKMTYFSFRQLFCTASSPGNWQCLATILFRVCTIVHFWVRWTATSRRVWFHHDYSEENMIVVISKAEKAARVSPFLLSCCDSTVYLCPVILPISGRNLGHSISAYPGFPFLCNSSSLCPIAEVSGTGTATAVCIFARTLALLSDSLR